MNDLIIQKLNKQENLPWDLFLLADPSRKVIENYLTNSEIYIAKMNEEIVGEFILINISKDVVELKNIAVAKNQQGKGIGKQLVMKAIRVSKENGVKRIEVGTGNSSLNQLALYQKCGFRITGIDKDFFTKNYPEKIVENGIKCVDMIRLTIEF
jgi:ribosomal protein S18 acetylase RimI-like enzyme